MLSPMLDSSKKEWFASWFDSEWYHLLYRNRNDQEAEAFLMRLLEHLSLPKKTPVLDLACGKGRHCRTLYAAGYQVTGLDLSENSIQQAISDSPDEIQFGVHDMRQPFGENEYDAVFNLFTSFGYFDTPDDNLLVLKNIHSALKENGILVLDFLNPVFVEKTLIPEATDDSNNVHFSIHRYIQDGFVFKEISVNDYNTEKSGKFTERVQLFNKEELTTMLVNTGFAVEQVFGTYSLDEFTNDAPRTILIARKS
jgi:SAM-dependent methyltransferase